MKRKGISEPNWLLIISFFIAGTFLGILGSTIWFSLNATGAVVRIHIPNSQYKFINSLLAVDSTEKSQLATNRALELSLQGAIDKGMKDRSLTQASIYVRDLEAGQWTGINETYQFSPGKLLKIPIMIAYYRLAESSPSVLEKKITVAASKYSTLSEGDYTVDDLIDIMISQSSDEASLVLYNDIDKRYLDEVYSDLGANFTEDPATDDFISTKTYSLFFRVLYNATYLNDVMSEKALALLSQTQNDYGLGSILPSSVAVSHSKGYRQFSENGKLLYEARDCGIIYYPKHPYLVCTMDRGPDLQKLQGFIADVSSLIYQDMDYRYKNK